MEAQLLPTFGQEGELLAAVDTILPELSDVPIEQVHESLSRCMGYIRQKKGSMETGIDLHDPEQIIGAFVLSIAGFNNRLIPFLDPVRHENDIHVATAERLNAQFFRAEGAEPLVMARRLSVPFSDASAANTILNVVRQTIPWRRAIDISAPYNGTEEQKPPGTVVTYNGWGAPTVRPFRPHVYFPSGEKKSEEDYDHLKQGRIGIYETKGGLNVRLHTEPYNDTADQLIISLMGALPYLGYNRPMRQTKAMASLRLLMETLLQIHKI